MAPIWPNDKSLHALAAFLDIEGAFSNLKEVWMDRVVRAREVKEFLVRWTSEILKARLIDLE